MARIKGIIMENKNGRAIILSPEGEYKQARINKDLEVGELYDGVSVSYWKYVLVATIVLTLTVGTMDYFSVKAYAQVASMELGINRWDRVVTARALDSEGEKILKQADLKGQKVDKAVESIVTHTIEESNSNAEDNPKINTPPKKFPLSATPRDDKNDKFKQKVEEKMNKGLKKALDNHNAKAEKAKKDKSEKNNKSENKNKDSGNNQPHSNKLKNN